MDYMIDALATFELQRVLRQPGKYRVPEDLTPDVAQDLIAKGKAAKIGHTKLGAPENKVMGAPENKGPLSRDSGLTQPLPSSPAGRALPEKMPKRRGRPPNALRSTQPIN